MAPRAGFGERAESAGLGTSATRVGGKAQWVGLLLRHPHTRANTMQCWIQDGMAPSNIHVNNGKLFCVVVTLSDDAPRLSHGSMPCPSNLIIVKTCFDAHDAANGVPVSSFPPLLSPLVIHGWLELEKCR